MRYINDFCHTFYNSVAADLRRDYNTTIIAGR
jgi:hypothetical protein